MSENNLPIEVNTPTLDTALNGAASLLRIENESIMAVARTQPRDPMKILDELQRLIDAFPAAADEAIYRKPVGTVQEVICADCNTRYEEMRVDSQTRCPACQSPKRKLVRPVTRFAEGLSIRAAENIRSVFGYTRLAISEEMLPDGRVKLSGVLVDYAAGNITSDERIVSPVYRSRDGSMVRIPEDRFLNVIVKAEKAKLRRDLILDSVPAIVKAMFYDACERKLAELLRPEVIEQKILPAFTSYGITLEHLEKLLGKPRALGWGEDERIRLRKLLAALQAGETTPQELIAEVESVTASANVPPEKTPKTKSKSDQLFETLTEKNGHDQLTTEGKTR